MWRKLRKWIAYTRARLTGRRQARAMLQAQPIRRVLVLCYGNIYRSPFVAARLQRDSHLEVRSAGFHPREGRRCEPGYIAIAHEFGVDLGAHSSRSVCADDLEWADIVLIMDGHNYRLLHVHYPGALARTCWLGAIDSGTPLIIEDPYKRPESAQRTVVAQLDAACAAFLAAINRASAAG